MPDVGKAVLGGNSSSLGRAFFVELDLRLALPVVEAVIVFLVV